jgi:hypothetical protein
MSRIHAIAVLCHRRTNNEDITLISVCVCVCARARVRAFFFIFFLFFLFFLSNTVISSTGNFKFPLL